MSTIIKVTTPIAITAIAVYMFFKKVIYTDVIYLGRWELLKSILNTAWIRLYIKTKEYFASERSKYDKPKNLEDITKEWLMKVLHSTKAISRNTKISKLQVQKIDAGQTGQTGRLKLEYADSTDENVSKPPPSMIVKMSRRDFLGSLLNTTTRLYRECNTYETILSENDLPTCTYYYTNVDTMTKDFILLLEDASYVQDEGYVKSSTISGILRDGRSQKEFSDEFKSRFSEKSPPYDIPSPLYDTKAVHLACQYIKVAAKAIASFHAQFWNSASLLENINKMERFANFARGFSLLSTDWAKTKEKARSGNYEKTKPWRDADNIEAFEKEIENAVLCPLYDIAKSKGCKHPREQWRSVINADNLVELITSMGGFSRIHGDFHTENLFVRQFNHGDDNHISTHDMKMSKKELIILDWQVSDVGPPVKDIAQLISMSGLDQFHKCMLEKEVVEIWWNELIMHGVSDTEYPIGLAWAQYKYYHAASSGIILMLANALKLFEDNDGTIYCMLVDSFKEGLARHGSPEKNYLEVQQILKDMGRL